MLSCQGVQTGERASLEIVAKEQEKLEKLADLGMRDKMIETFKEVINADSGLILISTMPKQGHSTLWRVSLESTDRFMRDFVALEDQNSPEEEVINITPNYYNPAENQTPVSILPSLLLKEPDVLVVPNLTDGETVNALCEQVEKGKQVIARIAAKNAAEALLRVLALKPKRELFARSVKAVINQRLFRTLCDTCKQGYAPAPQMLQKLGIPPGRVQAFYREYQPPPPGQVDDEGNPIPPMTCPQCNGIGYRGRSGLFELIMVNDSMRQVLVKQPQLASIQQAAKKAGNRNFQEEGILAVCLGSTSLQEIQRMLQL